ncbi:SDR family NAD(P)-dependent oxidoreductase [Aeromicrobium wangtongii]|uniref:SDR family oxidoreductase n=1 Tax=Aeromicrobium wangtongii TaxID=2969247 RepID=A0ABY5M8L7_9ACTN|nr:SDR family oxidoreductase [Aeromicrobium wangtongii]MCD9196977.1 SDR family oxidoreductase [Aeromicrobium wangtongii]UUP14479.1 SDR family oxidoreductase [Aeromicrobium wangtongii]
MSASGSFIDQLAGLDGKTAVVIGGAGGLGGYATWALARAGARVVSLDKVDADLHQFDAASLANIEFIQGDARDADDLQRTFVAAGPRVDVLVCVIGGSFFAEFESLSENAVQSLVTLNFLAPVDAIRAALPLMKTHGGSVITITSTEAHRGCPRMSIYAAMKAAMTSMTATLAVELGHAGVRFNTIAPDVVQTPNLERLLQEESYPDEAVQRRYRASVPLGRPGVREDFVGAVLFLASDLSKYVTGQALKVDGGTSAAPGFMNWDEHGWFCFLPMEVSAAIGERVPDQTS